MNEMSEIRAEVEFEAHIAGLNPGTWLQFKELFKKGIRNRIGIGLCLMMYAPPPQKPQIHTKSVLLTAK